MKSVSTEGNDVHTLLIAMVGHVVTDWREDLLQIDRQIIEQWSGGSFIHIARDHGTNLFLEAIEVDDNSPIPYLFGHKSPLDIHDSEISCLEKGLCRSQLPNTPEVYTYYNGSSLRPMTRQQSIDTLRRALNRVKSQYEQFQLRQCA